MATSVFGYTVDHHILSTQELREVADIPSHHVDSKVIDHIDPLSKRLSKRHL